MGQIEEYEQLRMLSQSGLKLLAEDPWRFYNQEERFITGELAERPKGKSASYFTMGDMVETLIPRPNNFFDKYAVYTGPKLAPQLKEFIDKYYELEVNGQGDSSNHRAMLAFVEIGVKKGTVESMVERFQKDGLEYYNYLRTSVGKEIVGNEEYSEAVNLVQKLRDDQYTGFFVNAEIETDIDVYDQVIVKGEIEGVEMKGLIDRIIIQHTQWSAEQYILDFKTSSSTDFNDTYNKYKYWLQAEVYEQLFWQEHNKARFLRSDVTYHTNPFMFIVGYTNGRTPEVWRNPIATAASTKLKELLERYKWHKSENKWKYPREVYENNGRRILKPEI